MRPAAHCAQALVERARHDPRIWVVDGDLADSYGVDRFAQAHPERFLMAGIAEQTMVSTAAGMAACGLRPWVFSFAAFLCFRAYDQIRVGLAQTGVPVTLVGSHAGGCGGPNGKSHQALNDIAAIGSLPNLDIWTPGCEADTRFVVDAVLARERPAYLRYPREPLGALPGEPAECRWIGARARFALVSCGLFTHVALDAARRLRELDVDAGVIHLTRLAPFPAAEFAALLRDVDGLWVVDDHTRRGGLADLLHAEGFAVRDPVFSWPADWSGDFGPTEVLLKRHGLAADDIAARLAAELRGGGRAARSGARAAREAGR
ncbi:transketolase family protein [Burkholderia gladioli]|uniref:transketolase family protein n=1 Tax=Burkholderia gladioli TaxID=28095 RepID=UPI000CFE9437|nr:transketolase C-terminal domain-containing protein [Burkholderia gladioli]MBU9191482.1 transketolase [Burkholderia gladioli]MDN7500709.1 transketolase C-terminal domain-containing protein [Burkholderia gladioli]MDN7806532.1 transketolase C-terminal domain-containing protein [Burkholderia gladioli]PRH13106.1 transketolase [Burkholderia gladioli]